MSTFAKDIDLLDAHIGVFNRRNLRHVDWILVLLVLALITIGLRTLHSASEGGSIYVKQALFFGLGGVLAFVMVCIDYRFLASLAPLAYVGSLVLLAAVFVVGATAKGGQHWLALGPLRLQPSELSKVALVYMLAWYLTLVGAKIRRFRYFVLAWAIIAAVCGLILLQGDLGTMMALVPVPFIMLYVAGCRWRHLLLVALVGLAAAPVAWQHLKPHQKNRLITFIAPEAEPEKSGYQLIQAKIAVGSGRLTGKGFGQGTQAHFEFIPECHNDFIFALLAEETGFVGAILVIGLFVAFLLRGLTLARDCPDMSATLLVVGALSILAIHSFMNIAVTLGLMPVTGLPLPFFSYGGSFCLTTMICIGTILSANVKRGLFE
ncbi:MAG: rod shape-determining protein RodA [Candidatus Hydrogenedentes bacterium]|nr:rod shape-determining protein RodA [Candidatus Hydrogenedentota bacterium]